MMLPTKYFGVIECAEEELIEFPQGLPAFESEDRFGLLESKTDGALLFLQSAKNVDLCFLALPVDCIEPGYELPLTPEDCEALGRRPEESDSNEDILCAALLTLRQNGPPTANLAAPLVIHRGTRRAIQAVRMDAIYSHQHPVC